jgi:type I restriction enzyme S subunit
MTETTQRRLGSTLWSIAKTQKLEALKTHKKGLMQQLFPSTEEANG